ncbi:MAG: hypothetical protein ACTSWY_11800 [Promethearchaeota archaeon]
MNKNIKKVIAILKHLGIRPDINVYQWRFFIQKITQISKSLGISLNYDFSIYLAGPYSRILTKDYYLYSDSVNHLLTDYTLTQEEVIISDNIKENLLNEPIKKLFLEAVSTIVYLKKNSPELTDDQIFKTVKSIKAYLNDSTIVIALNKTKELLFQSEFLTPEIQQEIDEWDSIDDSDECED